MFGVPAEFRDQVLAAAERGDVRQAVRNVYARLQIEIDRQKPICVASGKCCHFEAYGHRLYVTTLEMATFVRDLAAQDRDDLNTPGRKAGDRPANDVVSNSIPVLPACAVNESKMALPIFGDENPGDCQFQIDKLCGVHAMRPFGCRIFFCDPTAADWQQQQYEAFHAELKQLHEAFCVEYFYVEWRAALAAVLPG